MTSWSRVREIVEAALELEGAERARFLAERCGDDEALSAEVDALLAHDERADPYLDTPPGTPVLAAPGHEPELLAGTRLGPWVVRDVLASGGMGTVYRGARADDSFDKTVAIKVIKAGMDSAEILARFDNERRVLAELESPGIARLLDAGATADGRPWLVMEYVDGRPIDEHARAEQLDVQAKVALFCAVCDAVHAAHQRLVVHRDLKPDNILVLADGSPKLLDFGIAKVLAPDLRDGRATIGPSRVMTPEYASPEQVRGEPITTATDVWSLGVVLYELLAGRRPFDFARRSRADIERTICEREPAAPAVATDLDTIVLKAMHKDPARRYASAAQLAEDLRRFLAGAPVTARPDTWTYRLSKLVQRHRALVAAATVAFAALAVGLVVSLSARDRARRATAVAERRFDDVHDLARKFLFELDDLLADVAGSTPAREFVVRTGLEYLDALSREAGHDIELRRDVARGYVKIGDVQGGALVSNLGRHDDALRSYEAALGLAETLGAATAADRGLLALCLHRLGALEEQAGSLTAALQHYERALALGDFESNEIAPPQLQRALVGVQDSLVSHSLRTGDHAGALRHAEATAAMVANLPAAVPAAHRRDLEARAATRLGGALAWAGKADEAVPKLREAVRIARELAEQAPGRTADGLLCFCLYRLAKFLPRDHDLDERRSIALEAEAIGRRSFEADPDNAAAIRDLAVALDLVSRLHAAAGATAESFAASVEYRDLTARLVELNPEHPDYRADLIGARLALSRAQSLRGDHEIAEAECLKARDELEALAALRPDDVGPRRNLTAVSSQLGVLRSKWASAVEQPRRQLELRRAARAAFQDALDLLLALRREGRLSPSDERFIERTRSQVEGCEQSIAALLAAHETLK